MQYMSRYASPLGGITLASDGQHLTGLWFDGQKYFPALAHEERMLPVFEQCSLWLDAYFRGENPDFMPSLVLHGSPFRLAVWEVLRTIPYGETVTYRDVARELARQRGLAHMSAQAVGSAVGHNPISILVPCHRVVGANGSLTGYAGGIEKKLALLRLERADVSRFFVPKG